jgi:hypothetical protein
LKLILRLLALSGSDDSMAPKYRPTPLSGGDRKALKKELVKSRRRLVSTPNRPN